MNKVRVIKNKDWHEYFIVVREIEGNINMIFVVTKRRSYIGNLGDTTNYEIMFSQLQQYDGDNDAMRACENYIKEHI